MNNLSDATKALHSGFSHDPATNSIAVPIYQTSSYLFDSAEHAAELFSLKEFGNIYTRLMNPTTDVLEKRIASIDGGVGALATASGMAAIFTAVTNVVGVGDHIIASATLYGGTETLFRYTLPRFGIEVTFVDDFTAENIEKEIKDNTKIIYAETIGNPKGNLFDFESVTTLAHSYNIPVFVDNTFAPSLCKPFDYGVDVVVYSCTKWIGGHGTSLGGMICDSGNFDWSSGRFPQFTTPDPSYGGLVLCDAFGDLEGMGNVAFIIKARIDVMRNIGACLSPYNAFQLLQGVETLTLRMKQHNQNALALAKFLETNDKVDWVNYTGLPQHESHELAKKYLNGGFGSIIGFGVKGGAEAGKRFIENVKIAKHLANVGDAKTLVIHPWSTTHAQMSDDAKLVAGVNPEFIRVSVGIEEIQDIINDFAQALENC